MSDKTTDDDFAFPNECPKCGKSAGFRLNVGDNNIAGACAACGHEVTVEDEEPDIWSTANETDKRLLGNE